MKFSKLPKEKRDHLIMVGAGTVAALALLYFGLIQSQNANLKKLADKKTQAETELHKVENSVKYAGKLESELGTIQGKLNALETNMARGDLYSWLINTVSTFRRDYPKVEMPQFGPNAVAEEMNLFPKFPYKQAVLSVAGKAHYHDLGVFISDFENKFPHMRILDLDLKQNAEAANPGEREKLAFTMDIVTLVKVNP